MSTASRALRRVREIAALFEEAQERVPQGRRLGFEGSLVRGNTLSRARSEAYHTAVRSTARLLAQGLRYRDVAAQVGRATTTVIQYAQRFRLPRSPKAKPAPTPSFPPRVDPERDRQIVRLVLGGEAPHEVALRFRVSLPHVQRLMRRSTYVLQENR